MKKILLTLGATAAIVAPVASVVACGATKGENPTNTPPKQSGGQGGQTPNSINPTGNPQLPTTSGAAQMKQKVAGLNLQKPGAHSQTTSNIPLVHADMSYLENFTISEISEDPAIPQYLNVPAVPTVFKVFDNGLFKIKIQKSLIGPGTFFSDMSKAELEAKYIAQSINIGPAIKHLDKGIQILDSQEVASLGGNVGVQIALNNNSGSVDDAGLKNEASLVDHEYGHHETLWDFANIIGGDVVKNPSSTKKNLLDTMIAGLNGAQYQNIAKVLSLFDPNMPNDLGWKKSVSTDFPSDYSIVNPIEESVFKATNYPFNPAEVATRVLNVLSCRTDITPTEMYNYGKDGIYLDINGQPTNKGLGLPAAFVSDMTMRNHAVDSVFGEGKDATRVQALGDFYMRDIFGLGISKLHLSGDVNKGHITELNMSSFGATNGLATLEVQDATGNVVAQTRVDSFNSRFGFKNELITNNWSVEHNDEVQNVEGFKLDLDVSGGKEYKVIGKDKNGNEVDLSGVASSSMSTVDNKASWIGANYIKPEAKHLLITANFK